MKYKVLFLLLSVFGCLNAQQKTYTLTGFIKDTIPDGTMVYLQEVNYDDLNKLNTLDSIKIKDHIFKFQHSVGKEAHPTLISIPGSDPVEGFYTIFIAEPGDISMVVDTVASVQGGLLNNKHEAFKIVQNEIIAKMQSVQMEMQDLYFSGELSEEQANSTQQKLLDMQQELGQLNYNFIKENIKNSIGEFYLLVYANSLSPSQLEELYGLTRPEFQKGKAITKLMQQSVWIQKTLEDGNPYIDMTLTNLKDQPTKISDYAVKGKVVLLDFWASWCGPCRKVMPELASLYDELKDKGFEIVGISLDDKEADWKSAVESLNLTWPQLFGGDGGWNSPAAEAYGLRHIPQSFLIDKEGKIVARDLDKAALKEKVLSLLDK